VTVVDRGELTVLVLHWGRTASGPALTLRIADSLRGVPGVRALISYSSDAEIAQDFAELGLDSFPVRTWASARDVPRALIELPLTLTRLVLFLRRHRVDVVLVPMDQVLQSFVTWAFRLGGASYVHCLHDGQLHLGEASRLHDRLRRIHLRPANRVVVFSESVQQIALKDWGFRPDQVDLTHLPPIMGRETPRSSARSLPDDRPVVLGMFGRVVAYKGFDLAVEAGRLLRGRGQHVVVRLVGKGISSAVPDREEWLDLQDRWVGDTEVMETIAGFDLLLLPYREASQSGVLTEALALGVPVVATPVGGLSEQVTVAGAGRVATAVSAGALAEAIDHLLDPEAYTAVSMAELEAADGPMSWRGFMADVVDSLRRAR